MAEAIHLNGQPIAWRKQLAHPDPAMMVKWSKTASNGKTVKGSLRTICHINRLNNIATKKYGTGIVIIQPPYNTTVAASAGTHDFDACFDWWIPGVGWWEMQRFGRANGAGGWYRHWPLFGNHQHSFTLPPREGRIHTDDFAVSGFRVGQFVPGQLDDYYRHAFGLKGQHASNSDKSWFPQDIDATIFDLNAYIKRRAVAAEQAQRAKRKAAAAAKKKKGKK